MMTMLILLAADAASLKARVAALPRPAAAFIARRADCNHWTGEEPYDRARRAEIERAIRSLRCARIERDETAIRARYRANAAVIALLDETADLPGID